MKYVAFNFFLLLISFDLSAQNYDTRFELSSINCESREVCYHVQLRPNGAGSFNLAGQNYRIFYNSSIASFIAGQSLLPSQYGEYTLVQKMEGADASEMNGPLEFESTLGFLNFAMDLNDTQNGGINLPANEWTSTTNLCFAVEETALNNVESCLELIWGRAGLTDIYATAFVEVSRWVSTNNTTNSRGILYDDLDADDGASSCLVLNCQATAISVSDVVVDETMGNVRIQVCIAAPTTETVTVHVTTSDSTAVAPHDYTALTNAVITIPAGQTCSSIMIPITNDTLSQRSKIFYIRLTNPSSNATIGNGFAKVTIVDDEAIPTVSIEDVTVNENAGAALIVVCLSNVSSNPTSITMKTSDGSAVAGSDYGAESDRVLTIPSGVRCVTIHLNVLDDVLTEKSESFKVILSNISGNATIADGEATINIVDNDSQCQAKAPVISGN